MGPNTREYDRAYYAANREKRNQAAQDQSRKIASRNQAWVWEYLQSHPCVDCGEADPLVLEFDHRGEKLHGIAQMIWKASLARLEAEVAKCDVRCANCHRRKTARERGFWRLRFF